jgi:hypothetical protein
MITIENDKELKKWMKDIRLESPGPEFSSKVMEAILTETEKKLSFVAEPVLGKKFWILVILFVALIVFFILFPGEKTASHTGLIQQLFSGIPKPDWNPINHLISEFATKTGSLTWTLAAVMLGASILIIADNIFPRTCKFSVK